MQTTQVIITFETKPESLASFSALLQTVKTDLPQVSGCQGVQVWAGQDDPCMFTLLETWDSAAAHQAHIQGVVASGAWDAIAAHLAKDPVSHYYAPLP